MIWKCLRLTAAVVAILLVLGGLRKLRTYTAQKKLEKNAQQAYTSLLRETLLSSQATQEQRDAQKMVDRANAVKMLQEEQEDLVGWLNIEGAGIALPVMQSNEPTYYTRHAYTGKKSAYGSVYLNSENRIYGDIQVLQGSSPKDGLMLSRLWKLFRLETLKTNGILQYDTTREAGDWRIFAVCKVNADPAQGEVFTYAPSPFASAQEKRDYLYRVMLRTTVDTGVTVNENDDLLVIAAPAAELDGLRNVVFARRVRENETVLNGLPNAQYSKKTLYPESWYRAKGGEAPEVYKTFAEAQRRGRILDWYDGEL